MANETIYPYGQGGQTPSGIGLNSGTFADAYDLAKANNYIFPWMLIDEDEEGNPIKKMIWHTGNKEFIDAIGAEISGQKNGLTVTVTKDCDMVLNGTTYALSKGENNFSREDLSLSSNGTINNEILFYNTGTTTSTKSSVTAIDFGNIPIKISKTGGRVWGNFTALTKIKRLVINTSAWFYNAFDGCAVREIKASGAVEYKDIFGLFSECNLLEKADFSEMTLMQNKVNDNQSASLFNSCPRLKEVDVRLLNLSRTGTPDNILANSPIKKLTVGQNFTNVNFNNKNSFLNQVVGATLIIVSSTPPKLKNCSFTDGVANDEHATTYDWLSYTSNGEVIRRFDAIYVPDDAVETYKTDVYVENGTVGNTGWSYYADIIKPMSEYVE